MKEFLTAQIPHFSRHWQAIHLCIFPNLGDFHFLIPYGISEKKSVMSLK